MAFGRLIFGTAEAVPFRYEFVGATEGMLFGYGFIGIVGLRFG